MNTQETSTASQEPKDTGGGRGRRAPRERSGNPASMLLERYGFALIGVVAAAFFCFLPATAETFPTEANLQAVVGNQSVLAVVALAALIPLVCYQFDLSVGANLGLASVVGATLLADTGLPVLVCMGGAVLAGGIVGLINGLIVTVLRVNSLIATLGTATLIAGMVTFITDGDNIIEGIPPSVLEFGSADWFSIPAVAYVTAAAAIGTYVFLAHTSTGRVLYSIGSSEFAARLVGVNVNRMILVSFVVAGLLAGLAGAMQIARAGGANPQVGPLFTLPALAAAFLSAVSVRPGRFNVGGVLIAIAFLAIVTSGLNLAGAEAYVSDWVNGAALIGGVALAAATSRRRGVIT